MTEDAATVDQQLLANFVAQVLRAGLEMSRLSFWYCLTAPCRNARSPDEFTVAVLRDSLQQLFQPQHRFPITRKSLCRICAWRVLRHSQFPKSS